MFSRTTTFVLLALTTFGCCVAVGQASLSETERLTIWLDARFEQALAFSPMWKTQLGRKDDNDRLDDVSERAADDELEWRRATVAELRALFDYESLTPEAKASYDLWIYQFEQAEQAARYRRHDYIFTQMNDSPHSSLPRFLIGDHVVEDFADMTAYNSRLGQVERYMSQMLERAAAAAAEGIRPPRFAYETVIRESQAILTGEPFASAVADANGNAAAPPAASESGEDSPSPLWADARSKVQSLVDAELIDDAAAERLRAAAEAALLDSVQPAFEAIIDWAQSELELADEVATGVWKLPDGRDYYAQALAIRTTTSMTAEEVHALGLEEVDRIHAEMNAIRERVGFDGRLSDFFVFVRENPRFYLPNTDAGRDEYLERSRARLAEIEAALPYFFGLLPKAGLEVRRVEAFREQPGAAAHYRVATPDGSRPGIYYSHLADMSAVPTINIENLAYHEGLPGHHLQLSIAQELTGIPLFRTQSFFTAFIEGWGLYAEWLAKEMGGYEDPYADFGRLQGELWRAIRLVVDTGLHAMGWTEEDAVRYASENSANGPAEIRSEVQRYIVWPAQATTYKIGMLRFQALRRQAEQELGSAFDVRRFHDTLLGGGALPLDLVERRVGEWIAVSR